MLKVYVSGTVFSKSTYYADWLHNIESVRVQDMSEADVVIFTGGEDINPSLYNQPVGKRTYYNENRDYYEVADFKRAVKLGKVCIGICRG